MSFLLFDSTDTIKIVELDEIYCIKKEFKTRKIVALTKYGRLYFPRTIKHLKLMLSAEGFLQIDKNRIINLDQIEGYKDGEVTIGGVKYTVVKSHRAYIEKFLKL